MLVFWVLVGLVTATTLALSLPLYVDAVGTRLLSSNLPNPPYAFRFRYLGSWNVNIGQTDLNGATAAIEDGFTRTVGLPVKRMVYFARGGAWSMQMGSNPLGAFSLGALDGATEQVIITAGEWPPSPTQDGEALPILVPEKFFYDMGVEIGAPLTAYAPGGRTTPLKVAAHWRPANPDDPSWIFPPTFFDTVVLVQRQDLEKALTGLDKPVEEGAWYILFDGKEAHASDVDNLLLNITDGQRDVSGILPGIRMDVSPVDGLTAFSQEVNKLTQQLTTIILPVGGLVLYFVSMIAGLLVSRQQTEDVTLRSRGISRWGVLRIHFFMWLFLAGVSLIFGLLLAPIVVRLVGQTTSFMRFDNTDTPLEINLTPTVLLAGGFTALLAASSGLLLAWRTTQQTITSFKQQSRRVTAPWWQRAYIDVLLLLVAYYALYTLSQQGGLVTTAEDPFSDPLTFLGPTLFAFGHTLLLLRWWPRFLALITRIVAYGQSIALLLALRELIRSGKRYRGGMLMMCFTLSLTAFTASMASTIDRSLVDSVNYRIGADVVLVTVSTARTGVTSTGTRRIVGFNTLPATDLLTIPGIEQVSRVGRYEGRLILPDQVLDGVVLGVDRSAMPAIARFRVDYADESIASVFNKLAGRREGILINESTFKQHRLQLGQEVNYRITALETTYDIRAPIVGVVKYFPTLNPATNFFIITNIEPIWEAVGTELPHDIWLDLKSGVDTSKIADEVRAKGFPVVEWQDATDALRAAQIAPLRRGVLGFLSVGFAASILLTLVGAVIQSSASFREQTVQLGALRAMGLRRISVTIYLIVSQGLAAAGGIGGGTLIGIVSTLLFLPLLDFSGGLPPYLVRVAWNNIFSVYALFAGALFGVILLTTFAMGRQSLFTMVKLGEAA